MKITLLDGSGTFEVQQGETLYDALLRNEVYLTASCGGKGVCGKCRVKVMEGPYRCENWGKLTEEERAEGLVLACQCYPEGDMVIDIPPESKLTVGDKIALARTESLPETLKSYGADIEPMTKTISLSLPRPSLDDNLSDLERLKRALSERALELDFPRRFVLELPKSLRDASWEVTLYYDEPGKRALFVKKERPQTQFGLAVDIGTTTVALYLVDMQSARVIETASTYNSQMRYGDDVITRIINATEGGKLRELQRAVVTDINDLVDRMCLRQGINKEDITSVVISGNTTMCHLFWGVDPEHIRLEPYIPAVTVWPRWSAAEAGLRVHPEAPVYTVPSVASYVGGDIVAGVLATGIHRRPELSLFMDIGTNGEIVIGNDEWLMTAACSAGPCFEGSGIKCGMRATTGAIESVRIDRQSLEVEIGVIGESTPLGICGSGMIDAVAEMFLSGIIDQKGRLRTDLGHPRVREGSEGPEFVLYSRDGRDIVLTQPDLDNLIRAKGAIYAGMSLLLKEVGLDVEHIEKVYIAGGFGNYISVREAIIMGMLPDLPEDRFVFVGNTSVAGAYLCLMSEKLRQEAEQVASMMTYVELSMRPNYMDEFMSALFLPHTEIDLFPSVKKLLGA